DGAHYWLWDGYHRLAAWRKLRGDGVLVDVRVHQGSQADAQWASYAANRAHGLRRTNEDKSRAVQAALKHPNGASRSNREIGRYLGVDEGTVRHWREKLEAGAEIPQVSERTGADGKTYDTSGIGAAKQQQAAASMAELQALIGEWAAERWPDAWPENPSHTNGTFWQELTKHLRGNGVTWRDGDLKMAIKQMAALRRATPGRAATLDECIAAAWKRVKGNAGLTAAARLEVAEKAQFNHVRAKLAADVVAETEVLYQAFQVVIAELRGALEHEAKKEARRGGGGGGGGGGSSSATSAASVAQSGAARQTEPAEPTTGDERTAKLHRMKLLFMHSMDALTLWSEMTGRHSEVIEAKRGLRKVIDRTSGLIDGKVEESEEVQP
ncbi:MAG: hypothetical protein KAX65_09385, partial [Caldilineaceae bacterium]|nr:hypothetical protein [Caldilineaceae bacterium]